MPLEPKCTKNIPNNFNYSCTYVLHKNVYSNNNNKNKKHMSIVY